MKLVYSSWTDCELIDFAWTDAFAEHFCIKKYKSIFY